MPMPLHDRLLLWWGRRHIGEMIRRRALRRALRPLLRRGMRVLDVGCGRGDNALALARRYPGISVDAIDIDPKLVELVRRRRDDERLIHVNVQQSDVERSTFCIPPSASSYGIVYSVDVFEHLRDPAAALRHIAQALVIGGHCIIHVPRADQRRWFRRFEHYDQHDHERDGFEPEELTQLMRDAGLTVVTVRHTFGPPGGLAWELFHLANGVGKWCAILTYPVTWCLAWLDGCIRWQRGNGVLVLARKNQHLTPDT